MAEELQVTEGKRRGLLAFAPYATVLGVIAVIYFVSMRGRQTDDGALDLYSGLVALSVGLTVFAGLWWAVTSRGVRDLAAWWEADDPTAHVHLPIWGTAIAVFLACLLFYQRLEDWIGAAGVIFFISVLQLVVMNIAGRYLARRLEAGERTDEEVASILRWALAVAGGPFMLLVIVEWIFGLAVLTGDGGADWAIILFVLAPLMIFMLYIGFAIVYGAGEAVERTWSALFRRGGESG